MHPQHADVELLFQFKDAGTATIASWNVNSVRARLQNILEWLSYSEIDVLLIQEIKCIADQFPRLEFDHRMRSSLMAKNRITGWQYSQSYR